MISRSTALNLLLIVTVLGAPILAQKTQIVDMNIVTIAVFVVGIEGILF